MRLRWSSGRAWPACLLLAMSLGGCGVLNAADPSAEQKSLEYQTQFEELLPALVEQTEAGLRLKDLREESCLRPEIDEQHLETRWLGVAAGSVLDSSTANAALDRIGSLLDAEGWVLEDELVSAPAEVGDVRVLVYSQDDVLLSATYRESGGPRVEVVANTPCRENPPEHQLQRSELDPAYGIPSQYDGDGASS